jgi:hypothetical protein
MKKMKCCDLIRNHYKKLKKEVIPRQKSNKLIAKDSSLFDELEKDYN